MAKRRNLKKSINNITGELLLECVIRPQSKEIDDIMINILNTQDEFIRRISHTEPGNVKGFYKKLIEDYNKKVNEIIDALEKLS